MKYNTILAGLIFLNTIFLLTKIPIFYYGIETTLSYVWIVLNSLTIVVCSFFLVRNVCKNRIP